MGSRNLSPQAYERTLRQSREAKRRRRGTCEDCGAETRYNGTTINGPSRFCLKCSARRNGEEARGSGPMQSRLHELLEVSGELRCAAVARILGITTNYAMVLLLREIEHGRVVRVRRGVYSNGRSGD